MVVEGDKEKNALSQNQQLLYTGGTEKYSGNQNVGSGALGQGAQGGDAVYLTTTFPFLKIFLLTRCTTHINSTSPLQLTLLQCSSLLYMCIYTHICIYYTHIK